MYILGISAFYHDSAACLLKDGKIVAAAQEERFTRKKHDQEFPIRAVKYCLDYAAIGISDIASVVFYEKPFLKFERLVKTYLNFAPKGFVSFLEAMPQWLKKKLFIKTEISEILKKEFGESPNKILFTQHHQSHAASAFFPSPFEESAILSLDGVGEWATTSVWHGKGNKITPLWEIKFPHSLGLLYSAFTYYTGFKVNSGEYKIMGLAPYGKPVYVDKIKENLIDIKPDGTFRLDQSYFDYCTGIKMTNQKFSQLFGGPPRNPEAPVTQKEMDLARSIQEVTEEIILKLGNSIFKETGLENLCMAGGVALNCVANGRLLREGPFKNIWIQPAAGDAGGALGSALSIWHEHLENKRIPSPMDSMQGCFLGPSFSNVEIEDFLKKYKIPYKKLEQKELLSRTAKNLSDEKVIGWFQGRMEYGPRALGARSIIGDPRSSKMQSIMNLKIKFRESFRPFAPSILGDKKTEYFDLSADSPYMLLTAQVKGSRCKKLDDLQQKLNGIELLNIPKSDIPAVTHVDYSARVQTVHHETNPKYYDLIKEFEKLTGYGVIVNTSFNVRGEPIVCTPKDAYKCFIRTEMDCLVIEDFYLEKSEQSPELLKQFKLESFELD